MKISRRNFMKLSAAAAAALAISAPKALNSMELAPGEKDFSPITGKKREKVPSACWQCVARDGIVAYVEDGRVVKIEGNPELPRTSGVVCAKAQAGINQVYDPDRILYPLKRIGERGEGKWKRISWEEALDEVAGKLKELRDRGEPEKFMFHYGRMKASSSKIVKRFLAAYGTGTIGNHTSVCEGGKWTAQELTWGAHYDNNDVMNTKFIVNFGSNVFETHTNHVPLCQRVVEARNTRKVRIVTFDVRLSNTAARSDEWVPIKPGTDLAVILAMTNVVLNEELYDKDFIETWTNVTVEQLKDHYARYTPEWASGITGVPASKIRGIALELGNAKPGLAMGYRGPIAHYNGNEAERALMTLNAVLGNIDRPGGNCKAVGAKWKNSFPKPKTKTKKLHILDGEGVAYPNHHVSHQVFKMIKKAPAKERPAIYMWYCYNPVYINGECQENIEVMKSIPYLVAVDIAYSESTALADIILPDATYLERWDWEDMVAPSQVQEYYIRQPAVKPLGEARDFKDVCVELARKLGIHQEMGGFNSAEEFVKDACEHTPGVKEAGGFEYMKQHGAWYDRNAKPTYYSYLKEISEDEIKGEDVLFDEESGVYWNWKKSKAKSRAEAIEEGYRWTKSAYKGYVGQKIGDKVYQGFKPDKVNKSGLLEIYSPLLEKKGFNPMPSWMPIPEHQNMKDDELVLTTYKVNAQTHSRTQNCKWLTEIVHNNPGWINPATASKLGIMDGDKIKVRSEIGEITTFARVTEGIVPGIIAISHHCGHWEYGRYASNKKAPVEAGSDPDLVLKWWEKNGMHPNWVIPNSPDPINGQQRWFDTVVNVSKA